MLPLFLFQIIFLSPGQISAQLDICSWDASHNVCKPNDLQLDILLRQSEDPFVHFWRCELQNIEALCDQNSYFCAWDNSAQECNLRDDKLSDYINSCFDPVSDCNVTRSQFEICDLSADGTKPQADNEGCRLDQIDYQLDSFCAVLESSLDCISVDGLDNGTLCDDSCFVEYEFDTGECREVVDSCTARFTQMDAAFLSLYYQTIKNLNQGDVYGTLAWQPPDPDLLSMLLFPEGAYTQTQFITLEECYTITSQSECSSIVLGPPPLQFPPPPPPPARQIDSFQLPPEFQQDQTEIEQAQNKIDELQEKEGTSAPDEQNVWIILGGIGVVLVIVGIIVCIVLVVREIIKQIDWDDDGEEKGKQDEEQDNGEGPSVVESAGSALLDSQPTVAQNIQHDEELGNDTIKDQDSTKIQGENLDIEGGLDSAPTAIVDDEKDVEQK